MKRDAGLYGSLSPHVVQYQYFHHKRKFEKAEDTYRHWSAFAIEEGACRYRIGSETGEAQFGDLVVCPPFTAFGRYTDGPITFHYMLFDWADREEAGATDAHFLGEAKLHMEHAGRLQSTYALLRATSHLSSPSAWGWRSHLLRDLLALHAAEQQLPELFEIMDNQDPLMAEARDMLRKTFHQPVAIQNIASEAGLSPLQFTRRFQRAFRINPSDYLCSLRLKKAQDLLLQTGLNNDEIAKLCGFDNGFYFSRVFTRKLGAPPSEFRKSRRI